MNIIKSCYFLYLFALSLLFVSCTSSESQFLIGGSGWDNIAIVNNSGEKLWAHQLIGNEECNSVCFVGENKVLYSFKQGVKLIDLTHQVLWEYRCREGSEIHSASIMKDGNFLIGECGNPAKIYEFTPLGKKILEISFDTGIESAHSQFRRVYKTDNGTYLVPVLANNCIYEVDKSGQVVKQISPGVSVFSIEFLKNENWLLSCGDQHQLVEFNPLKQEIVWKLTKNDIDGLPLHFVAETIRLKNGNTIICNWGGHTKGDVESAQVFELDTNNNLVWKLEDHEKFGNVSCIHPLLHYIAL